MRWCKRCSDRPLPMRPGRLGLAGPGTVHQPPFPLKPDFGPPLRREAVGSIGSWL